uniref:Uncharacterized protein n=1 Tax=Arion vulgaris TaxID=1028688 RepID=A0A0B6Y542_9EUPU
MASPGRTWGDTLCEFWKNCDKVANNIENKLIKRNEKDLFKRIIVKDKMVGFDGYFYFIQHEGWIHISQERLGKATHMASYSIKTGPFKEKRTKFTVVESNLLFGALNKKGLNTDKTLSVDSGGMVDKDGWEVKREILKASETVEEYFKEGKEMSDWALRLDTKAVEKLFLGGRAVVGCTTSLKPMELSGNYSETAAREENIIPSFFVLRGPDPERYYWENCNVSNKPTDTIPTDILRSFSPERLSEKDFFRMEKD